MAYGVDRIIVHYVYVTIAYHAIDESMTNQ